MAEGERIIQINIEDEMKSAYIDYSMSVIVSRALPDVRDGFKPVHRRVFMECKTWCLFEQILTRNLQELLVKFLVSIIPMVISSVYDTMVRMAQAWSFALSFG